MAKVRSQSLLALLDNYLKGTAYSAGGTYGLAVGTPATLFRLYESDDVVNQYQATATDTDA